MVTENDVPCTHGLKGRDKLINVGSWCCFSAKIAFVIARKTTSSAPALCVGTASSKRIQAWLEVEQGREISA